MKRKLEFDSIQLSFGERMLLKSIYMRAETGSVTGLLGRNGCGKTTLMKIVFGALAHEQKSVRIDGSSLGSGYRPGEQIAYLPQQDLIPPYLTVRKAFSLFDMDEAEVTEVFPETVDMLDLKPPALSGGYLRMMETLLILKSRAPFCLLDEPFSGLTPVYIEKIKSVILQSKERKGIVITDHLYRHVLDISDRLYVLVNGQTYPVTDHADLISHGYLKHL